MPHTSNPASLAARFTSSHISVLGTLDIEETEFFGEIG